MIQNTQNEQFSKYTLAKKAKCEKRDRQSGSLKDRESERERGGEGGGGERELKLEIFIVSNNWGVCPRGEQ